MPDAGARSICFQDESGFSLLPSVRSTWAPRGKTPVLGTISLEAPVDGGRVGYAPDGTDAWLVFQMRPGSYNDETLIEFSASSTPPRRPTRSRSSGTGFPRTAARR